MVYPLVGLSTRTCLADQRFSFWVIRVESIPIQRCKNVHNSCKASCKSNLGQLVLFGCGLKTKPVPLPEKGQYLAWSFHFHGDAQANEFFNSSLDTLRSRKETHAVLQHQKKVEKIVTGQCARTCSCKQRFQVKKNGRQPLGNNYLSPLGVASLLLVIRKAAPRWRHILVRWRKAHRPRRSPIQVNTRWPFGGCPIAC